MEILISLIIISFLILFCIIYCILIFPRIKKPIYPGKDFTLYAHRGLHDGNHLIPENSLLAFKKAVESGYGIELDVQLTKDRKVVVFHDESLARICNMPGHVRDYTFQELELMRLKETDEKIPLFSQVLNLVDSKTPIIVEIKIHEKSAVVCELVNQELSHYKGAYCIESFNPFALSWYRKHRKDVFRGQLSTNFRKSEKTFHFKYFLVQHLLLNFIGRPDFIAFGHQYANNLSRSLVTKWFHASSICWTIRSQEQLEDAKKSFEYFIFEGFIPII